MMKTTTTRKFSAIIALAAIFGVALFNGCDTSTTDPEPVEEQSDLPPMPSFGSVENLNGTLLTIQFEYSVQDPYYVDYKMAYAKFGTGEDVGAVSVNEEPVTLRDENGVDVYNSFDSDAPASVFISFNGDDHAWSVEGGSGVPAMSDLSIASVSDFDVTQPETGARVSPSGGVIVQWDGAAETTFVTLEMKQNADQTYRSADMTGVNTFTIPEAALANFSGECVLKVCKYNHQVYEREGMNYVVASEVVQRVAFNLQ
jgi:hypothetical protein